MSKIVSCILVDDEPTAREVLQNHLSKIDHVEVRGTAKDAVEAFNLINTQQIDLIFLDINMPGISGLSFAKSINKEIKIIFTTAYREFAVEGFDLQAVDYLLKPISFERLFKAVNLYFDVHHTEPDKLKRREEVFSDEFIFVRADRKMVKVDYADIVYIESFSDYIKIHTKADTIVSRETISNIESKLPVHNFLRIHRSYIVSIANVVSYTHEYVEVKDKALPIGRTNKSGVLQRLEKH